MLRVSQDSEVDTINPIINNTDDGLEFDEADVYEKAAIPKQSKEHYPRVVRRRKTDHTRDTRRSTVSIHQDRDRKSYGTKWFPSRYPNFNFSYTPTPRRPYVSRQEREYQSKLLQSKLIMLEKEKKNIISHVFVGVQTGMRMKSELEEKAKHMLVTLRGIKTARKRAKHIMNILVKDLQEDKKEEKGDNQNMWRHLLPIPNKKKMKKVKKMIQIDPSAGVAGAILEISKQVDEEKKEMKEEERKKRQERMENVMDEKRLKKLIKEGKVLRIPKGVLPPNSSVHLARIILGNLHKEEFDDVIFHLKEMVDVSKLVTGEVQLSVLSKSITSARKQLLLDLPYPHPLSIPAFNSKGYAEPFLIVQKLDVSETKHPIIPFEPGCSTENLEYGMRSIVPSKTIFKMVFNAFTNHFFEGVDLCGAVIAGGTVSSALQPLDGEVLALYHKHRAWRRTMRKIDLPSNILDLIEEYADHEASPLQEFNRLIRKRKQTGTESVGQSDIDIFIVAETLEAAEKKLKRLYDIIERRFIQLGRKFIVARSPNSITFCSKYPYKPIQLIMTTLRSKEEFLMFCDLDCTSCIYDGREVYMSPRSVNAFNKRCNLMHPDLFSGQQKKPRVYKYTKRGFSTLIFEPTIHIASDEIKVKNEVKSIVESITSNSRYRRGLLGDLHYLDFRPPFYEGVTWKEIMEYMVERNIKHGRNLQSVYTDGDIEHMGDEPKVKDEKEEEDMNDRTYYGRRGNVFSVTRGLRWKWLDVLHSKESESILPRCYMCKMRSPPHFHPDELGLTLCVDCVNENKRKMDQWNNVKDINDCVALVTGARIKIGYYTALRLLRCGVTVIAVTRFPYDASLRYSSEPDFNIWKDKLHIYGVDFRHLPSVNEFINHVMNRYSRIDMLINNAAQTKRRPRAYYHEVVERERRLMMERNQCQIESFEKFAIIKDFESDPFLIESNPTPLPLEKQVAIMSLGTVAIDSTLPRSAALTQVQLHPMDKEERNDSLFPPGKVDEHNEPLDLRESTSWNQTIDEVHVVEMVEVQVVNSTVPFLFISSFTPLLQAAARLSNHKRSFIVNVTAVEGNFKYNKKSGGHPHTNMAKAALNMLTNSIAVSYAKKNIYTTSVDTGWCTEMRYVPLDRRDKRGVPIDPVPLSDRDGAARVLYPIYFGLTTKEPPPHGVLYHDFKVVDWC